MKEVLEKAIKVLADKSSSAISVDAQQYAQAALNLSKALEIVVDLESRLC